MELSHSGHEHKAVLAGRAATYTCPDCGSAMYQGAGSRTAHCTGAACSVKLHLSPAGPQQRAAEWEGMKAAVASLKADADGRRVRTVVDAARVAADRRAAIANAVDVALMSNYRNLALRRTT